MNNQESHTKTLKKAIRKAALKKEAEKFIAEGWEPHGGVSVSVVRFTIAADSAEMTSADFKQFLSISGITQARCAEMCYLTPRAISYYLSGERPVPRWLPEFIAFKLANPREALP